MSRKSDAPAPGCVRLVFIGDIVGKPGIRIVCDSIEYLRRELKASLIVANAENVADGSGIRCKDYRRLLEAGVDAMTLGDHAFRKREIFETLQSSDRIVRPANLPGEAP
ncbi:MAG: YmdB family metallophosphoesterase, partial [Planctomycetota bacterium]